MIDKQIISILVSSFEKFNGAFTSSIVTSDSPTAVRVLSGDILVDCVPSSDVLSVACVHSSDVLRVACVPSSDVLRVACVHSSDVLRVDCTFTGDILVD